MEVKVRRIRRLDFLKMRESGEGNTGGRVSVQLGRNGSQTERLGHQIGIQSQ